MILERCATSLCSARVASPWKRSLVLFLSCSCVILVWKGDSLAPYALVTASSRFNVAVISFCYVTVFVFVVTAESHLFFSSFFMPLLLHPSFPFSYATSPFSLCLFTFSFVSFCYVSLFCVASSPSSLSSPLVLPLWNIFTYAALESASNSLERLINPSCGWNLIT